jgi:outer membrane protein assembly factor BamA
VKNLPLFLLLLFTGIAGFYTPISAQIIADSASAMIIDTVIISGNERTKSYIIQKQMVLNAGDTIHPNDADSLRLRSISNIQNTGLFLLVQIDLFENALGHVNVLVQLEERWFLFPKPYFDIADRNFNQWVVEQNADPERLVYGLDLVHYNLTGHADRLNVRTIFGFTRKFEAEYERPFLTPKSETGWGMYGMYASNKQIYYATQNNKQVFIETPDYLRTRIKAGTFIRHRQGPYMLHLVRLQYNDIEVTAVVDSLNPLYLGNSARRLRFLSLGYTWVNQQVDNRSYPLQGHYLRAEVQKRGLGGFNNDHPYYNTANQFYISGQANIYRALGGRWYASGMLYGSQNLSDDYPYFITESLGYCENFVRGYEYYVIDGQSIGLFRSNLRFKALDKTFHSPIFKESSFSTIPVQAYLKLFADAGYVDDDVFFATNSLNNTFLYAGGIGLDLTTYYDWVFRVEGSMNALGEFGVYLHLGLDLNTYENCSVW